MSFEAVPETLSGITFVRLPAEASRRLPSRGQVAVRGSLDGHGFETVLEPDGVRGHWMRIGAGLQRVVDARPGRTAAITVEPVETWPEPDVPDDLRVALARAPATVRALWSEITPMARWEWVRWVTATRNPGTRSRRVEVTVSKMGQGKRRPCCFDLSACTDPELSRSGRLIPPARSS